jgi:hypothetical protein
MVAMRCLVVLGLLVACSSRESSSPTPAGTAGTVKLRYGDCAPATTTFESGPRPQSFDPARVTSPSPIWDPAGGAHGGGGGGPPFRSIEASPQEITYGTSGKNVRRPTILGAPTSDGSIVGLPMIARHLKRNFDKLDACGDAALAAKRSYIGVYTLTFKIPSTGRVAPGASAPGPDAETSTCLAGVLAAIEYPEPKEGFDVNAQATLTFRAPPTAEEIARGPQALDEKYVAGVGSPLHSVETGLTACLEALGGGSGVGVIELASSGVRLHGTGSQPLVDCVNKLAAPAVPEPLRCGFAYGEARVKAALGADISGPIRRVAEVDALVTETLAKRTPGDVLGVTGPIVVRPVNATPMFTVGRVLLQFRKAGADVVLAVQKRDEWALIEPLALPVLPVPRGTGARWDRHLTRLSAFGPVAAPPLAYDFNREPNHVSVLVDHDEIKIGTRRLRDRVPRSDAKRLATLLGLYAKLMDRPNAVQIAGADTVRYDEVVAVIEAARAAGFMSWSVVEPDELLFPDYGDGPPPEIEP